MEDLEENTARFFFTLSDSTRISTSNLTADRSALTAHHFPFRRKFIVYTTVSRLNCVHHPRTYNPA